MSPLPVDGRLRSLMDELPSRRRTWAFFGGLFLLGVGVRVAWILATGERFVPYADSCRFLWMAQERIGTSLVHPPVLHEPLFPWLLSAVFRLFGDSLLVARFTGALLQCLCAVPLFLWTWRVFDRRAAIIAAALLHLLPGLVSASIEIYDVNLAALLLTCLLPVGLLSRGFLRGFVEGLIVGLLYMTRSEGPVYGVGLALAALLVSGTPPSSPRAARVVTLAGLGLGFLLVGGLYLIHLRLSFGEWLISPKQAILVRVLSGTQSAPVPSLPVRALINAKVYLVSFLPWALSPLFWVLVPWSWFSGSRSQARREQEVRLFLIAACFLLTLPVTNQPNYRYLIVVLPLLLPWVGDALVRLHAGLMTRAPRLALPLVLVVALVGIVPQYIRLAGVEGSFGRSWEPELREAAGWIRANSRSSDRIGCGGSSEVFLAERRMATLPTELLLRMSTSEDLLAAYRAAGARFLILSERYPPQAPVLVRLQREGIAPGLSPPAFSRGWGSGHGVLVFDLGG